MPEVFRTVEQNLTNLLSRPNQLRTSRFFCKRGQAFRHNYRAYRAPARDAWIDMICSRCFAASERAPRGPAATNPGETVREHFCGDDAEWRGLILFGLYLRQTRKTGRRMSLPLVVTRSLESSRPQ
jgi:hypothetical protein